jgi:hypothetical protein
MPSWPSSRDVGDGAAGDRVEAQDPRRPRRDRHDDVVGADPRVAERAQALDRGAPKVRLAARSS